MQINSVLWIEEFEEKLWSKHRVTPGEAEFVLHTTSHVRFVEKGDRPSEHLYAAYGQTQEGRYLIVFFLFKPHLHQALPISGRDMTPAERRRYGKESH
jgi:uncharacterized DUF497 family protein